MPDMMRSQSLSPPALQPSSTKAPVRPEVPATMSTVVRKVTWCESNGGQRERKVRSVHERRRRHKTRAAKT